MHPSSLLSSLFAVLLLSLFLFTCTTAPTKGPNDRSNTTITLVGKSSKNIPGIDMVEDSVGNTFSIGFYSNFPNYLDSVQLYLVIPDLKDSLLKTFYKLTSLNYTDTSWHSMIFSDSGTQKIYCVAYINEYNKPATDTLRVIIHGKPVNYKPSIAIAGLTTISIGQQCNLAITANDTDKTQTITLNILRVPSGAVFNAAGTFIWTPPKGFIGNDSAIFVAKDNGYPVMYDTAVVIITVLGSSNNHAPAWQKKTINEVGQPGVAISITLSDKCTDPDGDTLTFLLLSGAPANDSIIDAATNPTYTFTPGAGDTGVFNPRIVAKDPQGLADTLTIALSIHAPKIDSLPPVMKLVYPATDNASVSSSSIAVKIQCTDPSGVASVRCSMEADTFQVTHTDSIYAASISGLKQGVFDTIAFIAIDASSRANADTFFVHIKYDSSIVDNVPPAITLLSPSKDTIIGRDSCVVRVKCTDESGITSVVYTLGAQTFTTTKSPTADSIYSATVKGLAGGVYSSITIIAIDASPAANKDSTTIRIKYDNDKTAPTLKLFSPAKDSASVSGNAIAIQVVCKDPIGVASITYGMGSGSPQPMTKSASADTLWSANVTGLTPGYNTVRIIAIDSSLSANRDTLLLNINYDTTKADNAGPTITKISGLATGSRTANANDTLVYTVTDASDVDTVSWTLNGVASGVLTAANGQYSIKAALTKSHTNTIVIIASDKSANHNKSSDTTIVDYNRLPVISGAHDTTIQELSTVQFTVSAKDPDSDNVTLSATGLPTGATFVPATGVFKWVTMAGQNGTFPVTFKANDGLDIATKSINIVISNMPPPTITKDPVADTVCLGSSASFFVVATGTGLTYQWKNASGNLSGAHYKGITKDTLFIDTVKASDAATYTCVVTNSAGSVASSTGAKLTVNNPSTAPTLAANSASVCSGGSVTFTMTGGTLGTGATWAAYAGTTKLSTQPAITSNSFTISNITAAVSYSVKAENGSCDNASSPPTSNSVTITMNQSSTAPTLAANITSVCPPGTVIFTITGTLGTGANWAVYAGGTKLSTQPTISNNSFTISNISAATTYSVKAEGGTCDNAGSPPTSNNVTISISTYNITFNSNGGTPVPSVQTIPCNGTASAPTTAQTPSKTGYNLVGWYLDTSSSTAYNFSTPITAAITLNAKWAIKQYTLAFNISADVAGVSGQITASPSKTMYDSNSTVTLTAPIDNNYTFTGWAGSNTGSTNQISVVMNGNKTLTANYTIRKYTLTITTIPASGGGSFTPASGLSYNSGTTVPLTASPNTGYNFVNWTITSGTATLTNANSATTATIKLTSSNAIVTANFTGKQYIVTFDGQGATTPANPLTKSVTYPATTLNSLPTPPARTGYIFDGWFTGINGAGTFFTASITVTRDTTVYAKWVIRDADANEYTEVKIGTQTWMVENYRVTKYTNGSGITQVIDGTTWGGLTTPALCYYNNTYNADSIKKFGALYNWYALSNSSFTPSGWHVPTKADWDILQSFMIANEYNWDGSTGSDKIAKSLAATTDWTAWIYPGTVGYNLGSNNRSGFTGLPGGGRDNLGNFFQGNQVGCWWSTTEDVDDPNSVWMCSLMYDQEFMGKGIYLKNEGFSVRLVRDY